MAAPPFSTQSAWAMTIDAEPKIPRGGTDLIMSVHGVEQAEARSTQTS